MNTKTIFFISLLVLLTSFPLFSSITALESNLGIPTGQQFILGGGQSWKLKARIKNKAFSSVEIRTRDEEGREKVVDTVRPFKEATADFPARSAAVLRNLGKMKAQLNLKIGSISNNLGMRYEDF